MLSPSMPKDPKGHKRPADVIGNAVLVMRLATGEIIEPESDKDPKAVARGRAGGRTGGKARAAALSPTARKRIAKQAAAARWKDRNK